MPELVPRGYRSNPARRDPISGLVRVGAIGVLGYVAYQLASGSGLLNGISLPSLPSLGGGPAAAAPRAPSAPGAPSPTFRGSATGDTSAMLAANPNILGQMATWQGERRANREDPYDWGAFRVHAQRIGAPDPGPYPPPPFAR